MYVYIFRIKPQIYEKWLNNPNKFNKKREPHLKVGSLIVNVW